MHRWFFAGDHIEVQVPPPPPNPPTPSRSPSSLSIADTYWNFNVKCDWKLCPNESLAVCGSVPELGNWNPKLCVLLNRETDSSCWSATVLIPHKHDIYYRYLICITKSGQKIVRFWETHQEARFLSRNQILSLYNVSWDDFGVFNNKFQIERGWISSSTTVVQFKFYKSPFELKTYQIPSLLYVKITPIKVKERAKCEKVISEKPFTAGSIKSLDIYESDSDQSSPFAFCEVSSLKEGNEEFHKQPECGTPCGVDDILIFHLTLSNFEETAYLIDLFQFGPKAASDVPAQHFGYQYVFCKHLKGSEGTLNLAIMCASKHRPIGGMKCDYLVVKPMSSHDFTMDTKFQRHWSLKQSVLDIGHRGCGISFYFRNEIIRENTIDSFNLAFNHGADMVEFDVQLTKDGIPIVYHDFQLYFTKQAHDIDTEKYDLMKLPMKISEIDLLKPFFQKAEDGLIAIPLNKFTKDQLKRAKDFETSEKRLPENPCPKVKNNRPFVTLETVFKRLNAGLGFLVELKWPQKYANGTRQEHFIQDFDKNEFVDVILTVVLKKAGSRTVVFVTYDADICTMIQLKQNVYPVLFMVHDAVANNKELFWDSRGDTLVTGSYFAKAMQLLGTTANCSDVLETPEKVAIAHKNGLCLFCCGPACRQLNTRRHLKNLGVDGIIFDRINHVIGPPDLKRALFLVELLEESVEKFC